jgi:prepilin-type N-terminal cleavage/methylation domain-containing protein
MSGEAGFSLVELLVSLVLFSLISAVAFTAFNTISRTSQATEQRSFAVADARQALETIIRDLRAANPIDPRTPVSSYDTSVSFDIFCSSPGIDGCRQERLKSVEYTFSDLSLSRIAGATTTFVGPSGPSALPRRLQRGAILNEPGEPVFTFFDAKGDVLLTQPENVAAPPKHRGWTSGPPSPFETTTR